MKWTPDKVEQLLACVTDEDMRKAFPSHRLDTLQRIKRRFELKHKREAPEPTVQHTDKLKKGLESRADGRVMINWSNRQVITDLGEYGTVVWSFERHGAFQRAYSEIYEGKPEDQEEMARRFDLPGARAVGRYCRLHGIRHSSLGQTDLEFEAGLITEEEAVEETISSVRRRVYKKTQEALWKQTQQDADKWRHFEESVLEPLREDIRTNLPKYEPPKLNLHAGKAAPFVAILKLSDLHFAKYAFDSSGSQTYGVAQAIDVWKVATDDLIAKTVVYGVPERFIVPVGTDNLHADNAMKTTTRGTPQDFDGEYETTLKPYIDGNIRMIEALRQVAPVTVVVVQGNHDKVSTMWLGHLLAYRYEDAEDVEVLNPTHPRVWMQIGDYGVGFAHGDPEFTSTSKKDRNVHKLILAEARDQGVNIQECKYFYLFTGNLHTEESKDYGVVSLQQIPALCGDDRWHKENVFIGNRREARMACIDLQDGLVAEFTSAQLPK